MRSVPAGLLTLALALPAVAADLPDGNWRLSQLGSPTSEFRLGVIQIEKKGDRRAAKVLDTFEFPPQKKGEPGEKLDMKVTEVTADGATVRLSLEINENPNQFEGVIDPKDPKVIRGFLGDDRRGTRATLVQQDVEKLEALKEADLPTAPEPIQELRKLAQAVNVLRIKAQRAKDVDEKADLVEQIKAGQKDLNAKAPGFYRETFEKHAASPFAIEAAAQLVRLAGKEKASAKDLRAWTEALAKDAARYGPRYSREEAVATAEALRTQKGLEAAALAAARRADGMINEADTPAFRERALRALRGSQAGAGNADDAKVTDARLEQVVAALDKKYAASVPPFKPEPAPGRKDKEANRAVVMELFTGAQCPPCVAADVAFDALIKAYSATDLILIQYHLHIPGPDPLTNADSEARYDAYKKLFANGIGGTPSTLFNGQPIGNFDKDPTHRGGGPMKNAKNKFDQYRAIIDPQREEKSLVKLTGTVGRDGDKVSVSVLADGVKGEKVVVRLLLIEDEVRYVGGNGLRVHHHVVRGFPGGVAGTPVMGSSGKASATVSLADVRKELVAYLDKAGDENPFPYDDRPMDLAHLKVIALVQDDETGEILNAAQFDVPAK